MARIYSPELTAAQVAVAKEYRKALRDLANARGAHQYAEEEWAEAKKRYEPMVAELAEALRGMGLDPADFED